VSAQNVPGMSKLPMSIEGENTIPITAIRYEPRASLSVLPLAVIFRAYPLSQFRRDNP